MYQLVQVMFEGSARRYTYLAPFDWRLQIGDTAYESGMTSRARVVKFVKSSIPLTIPLKVLEDYVSFVDSASEVTVRVPDGYRVDVVRDV